MKAATRARFLTTHKHCCFCGGAAPSTTIDHQPGRVLFRGKRSPDNHIYPACQPCQDISRDAENLISLLVARHDLSDEELSRWSARHRSIRDRYPEHLSEIIPSDRLRQEFAPRVSNPPTGLSSEHMITLNAELWHPVFQMFAKKLVLALHYKAWGKPLASTGRMLVMLAPNGHYDAEWDKEIRRVAKGGTTTKHGNENLNDQFSVLWATNLQEQIFCVRATLQQSLIVYGFTIEGPPRTSWEDDLDGPFQWHLPRIAPESVRSAKLL